MPEKPSGERSEKATPTRKKKARKDGQLGNSPELGAWFGMLAATFVIPHVATSLLRVSTTALVQIGTIIRRPEVGPAVGLAARTTRDGLMAALPLALLAAAIGVASVAGQGTLWFSTGLLKPKFSRMNPLSGVKRMFGKHGAWQLVKSLLKSVALGVVVWLSVRHLVPTLMGAGSLPLARVVEICCSSAMTLLRWAAVAGLLMAFIDVGVTKKRNDKHTKMTKQELKEEAKSSEGDPHVRQARRSRQMAMRRNRMMADVPLADVVVVNPTHVAVALKYDPQRGAPRVVAKGADHQAARIRALAEQHRVPMVADIPLARTLHASCRIGDEIPADLYRAVATVLAFIMTLRRRGSTAGVHSVRTLDRELDPHRHRRGRARSAA